MAKNSALNAANKSKNDEFYTQLSDIEQELKHYRHHFKDKTVLCNCDDPFESNFFKYFCLNFNKLGLKKLIATSYDGSPIAGDKLDLLEISGQKFRCGNKTPYKAIVTTVYDKTGDGELTMDDIAELLKSGENKLTELQGSGDFRSEECIELLKEADIVVTNPPFSLFREYMAQLMKYDKKFLIIGNQNALTYKEIFPLIKENKIWLGYPFPNGNAYFKVEDGSRFAKGVYNPETGLVKFRNCHWFTNLDITRRHEDMILTAKYDQKKFPPYDNYDAIEVDRLIHIPKDYDGIMGVPITFLSQYNPEQFEILGMTSGRNEFDQEAWPIKRYENPVQHNPNGTNTNGSKANTRATILVDKIPNEVYYTADNADKPMVIAYARVLIRNRHPEVTR